jgi:ribosome biogenesis GTPase
MPQDRPEAEAGNEAESLSGLADLGWSHFFGQQLSATEFQTMVICRVMAVHRSLLHVVGMGFEASTPHFTADSSNEAAYATVGDWLLLHTVTLRPERLLRRRSLIKRRAAGKGRGLQLIAANIDTLFIVTSCNHDFNIARLERYLALAQEAGVSPVVVITKSDLASQPEKFEQAAVQLLPGLKVLLLDARNPDEAARLSPWCGKGQTVALVGSSGVGKSTLINALTGTERIFTQVTSEKNDKGRHTTTAREFHRLQNGGWLLDTPGMRELQLTDAQSGLSDVFSDITRLAQACRFRDCRHKTEPGCAVRLAVEQGELDGVQLERWRKLTAEEAFNTMSLADRRAKDRAFRKMVKSVKKELPQ